MTANDFRKLALSFPEAVESAHMHHPDFRAGKVDTGFLDRMLKKQNVLVPALVESHILGPPKQ